MVDGDGELPDAKKETNGHRGSKMALPVNYRSTNGHTITHKTKANDPHGPLVSKPAFVFCRFH